MSIPATIARDLMAELDSLSDVEENQFQINLLLKKADKLLAIDAFTGYLIKGILCSYLWDEKNARSFFAKAEMLSKTNILLYLNQAVVFGRFSYDTEARESYLKAVQVSRASEEAAYQYVLSCISSNRPDLISVGLDLYNSAGGEKTKRILSAIENAHKCTDILESAEINFSFAESMHALVGKVVRAFKVRDLGTCHTLINEDGLRYLSVHVSVVAPIDVIVQMNEQLNNEILGEYDFTCEQADKIIYQFLPLPDDQIVEKSSITLSIEGA
jgi:hypothetical protein